MTGGKVNNLLRRTSFIVEDVEKTADFYQIIFDWTRFYDTETPVDMRFPPCAPDQTTGKIIILKVDDPFIGMIGFMEYDGFVPERRVDPSRKTLGIGDAILIVESKNIQETYQKAQNCGANLVTPPVEWSVKGQPGQDVIRLSTFSFFDLNGIYVEVNTRLSD
ncbi:MAG: hypothetical protein COA81_00565 [Alphaproteobacteria bacterium]|nr:MAG: hypothetical protein COA81_00565 [Alphaproteobacteria bacterium]